MAHGRAYRITRNDVRGYHRTEPPMRRNYGGAYRPNPIGVTTLASINGRGAYGRYGPSAYERVAPMSRNERYGYARGAVRGDDMTPRRARRNPPKRPATAAEQKRYASGYSRTFGKKKKSTTKRRAASSTPKRAPVSKKAEQKRKSSRETVYRRLKRAGYGEKAAAKRAMKEVPFLKSQKDRTFHGEKAYTGKAVKKKTPKQYKKVTTRVTKTVPATKKVTTTRTRRKRVAYGRFKRLYVTDPRTGKKKLSNLYKDPKTGKRRKIPAWAIAGAPSAKAYRDGRYDKKRAQIRKRRESAARRVVRRGGPFTPNKKRKTGMAKSTKRSKAAKKGWATRRRKKAARSASAKKRYRRNPATKARRNKRRASTALVPNRRRKARRNKTTARKNTTRRRATANRRRKATPNRRRRTTANRRKATPNRRRARPNKSASRSAAAKKGWRTRRRRETAKRKSRGVSRGRGRAGVYLKRGKVYYKGKKPRRLKGVRARKLPKSRIYITNRRRKARRNRSRRNSFMASFRAGLRTAMWVTTGFVAHKALTRITCDFVVKPLMNGNGAAPSNGAASGLGQTDTMQRLAPIAVGGLVAAAGIFLSSKLLSRERTVEVGAGMLTSFLHTTLVSVLDMSDASRKALPYVSGYDTQSTAAAIGRFRGRRGMRGMRGMRGLGQQGPATSILPMYAPTGRPGGIQQAVAMAGGRGGRMGEYFQTSGVGEYFASGVQGIGQYEPAGPMVTQAAAGLGQQIDNGVMPNEADAALTLAEAQAGTGASMMGTRGMGRGPMGRAMGEYFSARPTNGEWEQYRVPTSNTWIPGDTNAELWAGTKPAQDSLQTSEIPAGVLESASGNGIF